MQFFFYSYATSLLVKITRKVSNSFDLLSAPKNGIWHEEHQSCVEVEDHLVLSSSIVLSAARLGRAPVPLLPPLIETNDISFFQADLPVDLAVGISPCFPTSNTSL